jgi:lipoprotein-anchoring transpeptidase ErfK/SrfK
MTRSERPAEDLQLAELVRVTYNSLVDYAPGPSSRWLFVDTAGQLIFLVRESTILSRWSVSTAEVGLDNRESSGGTPPGVHRVAQKIGSGAPAGTVFESRKPTGETWQPTWNDDPDLRVRDLILSRILILDGLEPGLNQGSGIDTRKRYIYIHGTNHEDLIGRPAGGGCVRMGNRNIIDLFDQIEEGDLLVIV